MAFAQLPQTLSKKKIKKILFSWLTDSFLLCGIQRETSPYCLSFLLTLCCRLQKITGLA